ncbi:MAG: lipid A deacylase LpxR family protein [Verrucomicrobia bacterium]|nr:lipid A deacylase LpxR family protein [Verrucomicrobiota bacterium]MCF7709007.1 lipid A deacylase LpxR family protein [Verrucomicrobiota bacterium]
MLIEAYRKMAGECVGAVLSLLFAAGLFSQVIFVRGDEGGVEDLNGPVFVIIEENDLVVDTDRHYTQGAKLTFLAGEESATDLVWEAKLSEFLPSLAMTPESVRYGVSVGQCICTPADTDATQLLRDERPYAGYLYVGLMLQRRVSSGAVMDGLDQWQLDLGVIGPESLAEDAQNSVHEWRGFGTAEGWDNQLETEPGIALRYQRIWRMSIGSPDAFEFQVLPQAGASLGNVGTYVTAGAQCRAGYRMPDDFGFRIIDSIVPASGGNRDGESGHGFGFYLFGGVDTRLVGYTAFLDGNLFRNSHSVSKRPFVNDFTAGLAVAFKNIELGYAQVLRTEEYVRQAEPDSFGTLAIKIKW